MANVENEKYGEKVEEKEYKIVKSRNYNVVKSNRLVQKSRFDFTVTENKILIYLLTQIKPTDEDLRYKISLQDFCEFAGINYENRSIYHYIRKVIEQMAQKFIWITIEENGEEKETMLRVIERPYINKKTGEIEVKIDDMLKEYLVNQDHHFTIYQAIFALPMKSSHSLRIYEILKSYENQGVVQYNLDTLKKRLMVDNQKSYDRWYAFKTRVLDVAMNEINEMSDLNVSYKTEKTGRSISKVIFSIHEKGSSQITEVWVKNNDTLNAKESEK